MSDPNNNNIEAFWEWKRNTIKRDLCKGKYKEYRDFIIEWNTIKDKKDEVPEKGTGLLTDYYSWKCQGKPVEDFTGPSEPFFEKYFNNIFKKQDG